MNLKDYVSPARAAEIRGVSLPRIIAMIKAGQLTPIPYDGGYVLKRSEVEGYEKKKGGRRPQNGKS
jgi:hypothetical protein